MGSGADRYDYERYVGRNGEKPERALATLVEGKAIGRKFQAPLDPALAKVGVTKAEWEAVTAKLGKAWNAMSRAPTIMAIEKLNGSLFIAKGCFATYAEYGWGAKAMTIYTLEDWQEMHPQHAEQTLTSEAVVKATAEDSDDGECSGGDSSEDAISTEEQTTEERRLSKESEEGGSASVSTRVEEGKRRGSEEHAVDIEDDRSRGSEGEIEVVGNERRLSEGGSERPAVAGKASQQDTSRSPFDGETVAAKQWLRDMEEEIEAGVDEERISPFIIRNLDTGESTSIAMGGVQVATPAPKNRFPFTTCPCVQGDELDPQMVRKKLTFGTVCHNADAWQALLLDSQGIVEKLANSYTLAVPKYQLCVWQERFMYADEDALCYQHLTARMQPTGPEKRIPYATIEFVGPFDETQFILKCEKRVYTFLCDSAETRTRWIKNISQLAGCSATTQVCHKTESIAFSS